MTRTSGFVAMTIILVAALVCAGELTPQAQKGQFIFSCVVFGNTNNQEIFKGAMDAAQFRELFEVRKYGMGGGGRLLTPPDAIAFGALTLTDGQTILVVPLFTWKETGRGTFFASQFFKNGEASMFSVSAIEQTQNGLIQKMRELLGVKDASRTTPPTVP
jgi:hypothetical protein